MGMDNLKYVHLKNLWGYMKMPDEIIRELWKVKDGIADEFDCDLTLYVAHLRAKDHKSDQRVVNLRSMKENGEIVQTGRR
jgi:hypothetical protein